MSQTSQNEPAGNTKTAGYRHQKYRWFFTIPYEEFSASQLSQHLKDISKEFLFSGEIGKTGYKHWQGCFSLKQKEYFSTVKNLFPQSAHLEECQNWLKAKNYCKKEETHLEGPYDETTNFIIKKELNKEWQFKLKDEVLTQEPDYRKIICYVNLIGGAGKTDFALHMYDYGLANVFPYGGVKDIADCLRRTKVKKIIIFDIPRTMEGHVSWTAIECIKNGYMFAPKYESEILRFNKPHVICMLNFMPTFEELSEDRFDIRIL